MSSLWSVFNGASSAASGKAPKADAGAAPQVGVASGTERGRSGPPTADSVTGQVDMRELFGQPPPGGDRGQEPRAGSIEPLSRIDPQAPRPPNFSSITVGAEDPVLKKVDDYITEHFYSIEARMKNLEQKMDQVVNSVNNRESQVTEVFQQVKVLIELQFAETKKGIGRDNERTLLVEQFQHLKDEVLIQYATEMSQMKANIAAFDTDLADYGKKMVQDIEDKLKKRDDSTYKFEADLMSIKKSFSSLRLELNKYKKAQDFKNTSTSVFFMKAIDMKPDERKRILRTLNEQEEKNRGAIEKAENDLRDHEKDDK